MWKMSSTKRLILLKKNDFSKISTGNLVKKNPANFSSSRRKIGKYHQFYHHSDQKSEAIWVTRISNTLWLVNVWGSVPTDLANWGPSGPDRTIKIFRTGPNGPGPDLSEKECDETLQKTNFDYPQCSCVVSFWVFVIEFLIF